MATVQQIRERDVQKAAIDLLGAEQIPVWRMNAGDRFGSYTSKRTGKTKNWRIKGHEAGTSDLLCSPRITRWFPWGSWEMLDRAGQPKSIPIFLFVEIKKPGEVQTADQIRFEQECFLRGHAYICIDDVQQLIDWLKEHGAIR